VGISDDAVTAESYSLSRKNVILFIHGYTLIRIKFKYN